MPVSPPYPPDETTDLLEWYLYAVGESEIPEIFHHWCFLSLVAATVQNRVWIPRFHSRMYPNLYLMLIGDSGCGKNTAIGLAQRLARELESQHAINLYRGKITAQALISRLGTPPGEKPRPSYIWLATPELSMAVGDGDQARGFIKHMTELYEGDYDFMEETRTRGTFCIKDPCVNWLAGTTPEWLVETVSRKDIQSGFFARAQPVWGEKSDKRYVQPVIYPRADEVWSGLQGRLNALSGLVGGFSMTKTARKVHEQWYLTRRKPHREEGTLPYWARQDDIVWKLAMLFSLCREPNLEIRAEDVERGIAYSDSIKEFIPMLQEYTWQNKQTEMTDFVIAILRRSGGRTHHSKVLQKVHNRGMSAPELELLMSSLEQQGRILRHVKKSAGRRGTTTIYSLIDEEGE